MFVFLHFACLYFEERERMKHGGKISKYYKKFFLSWTPASSLCVIKMDYSLDTGKE